MSQKKVVISLSGGVDSAVSAILLQKKKFKVYAVHMQNWDRELLEKNLVYKERNSLKGCSNLEDLKDTEKICEILSIPLKVYNFVPEYWEYVFKPYLEKLKNYQTSNPDILCNKYIKFGVLLSKVKEDFGEDFFFATGHWAKILRQKNRNFLSVCKNKKKDQTYFLSALSEKQLEKVLFPLENIEDKEKVREIAKKHNLPIWDKKDSRGICFIGKRNYPDFISNFLESKEGKLVDIESKKILGTHQGAHLYVLNQSKGFGVGGLEEKYHVCGKNLKENIIFLSKKSKTKKYLYKKSTYCEDLHWISYIPLPKEFLYIKSRHTTKFLKVEVVSLSENSCTLSHKLSFITSPGQYIVFYSLDKKICLGCGVYKC